MLLRQAPHNRPLSAGFANVGVGMERAPTHAADFWRKQYSEMLGKGYYSTLKQKRACKVVSVRTGCVGTLYRRLALNEAPEHSGNAEPGPSSGSDAAEGIGGSFPIVGIGMSAGGLEVATAFLKAMPPDSGMAFVIIQHLDSTRESILADLLRRQTEMPVVQVDDGMCVEPNRVYVIVPARTLLIEKGILRLVEPGQPRGHRHPIDEFFASLAQDQKAQAIAIVLSGAGSNGSAGVQDIKQAGGMCIAQDPGTAKFDSMPRHAIATGAIDFVLPPDDIPQALLSHARHSYVRSPQPEMAEAASGNRAGTGIDDVITLLHARAGQDFRQYKHNTLSRRIHRRMSLAHMERLDDYFAWLEKDTAEAAALVRDLLIHVTAFFRDSEAWDALDREVITPLVENAERGQAIRVWAGLLDRRRSLHNRDAAG